MEPVIEADILDYARPVTARMKAAELDLRTQEEKKNEKTERARVRKAKQRAKEKAKRKAAGR